MVTQTVYSQCSYKETSSLFYILFTITQWWSKLQLTFVSLLRNLQLFLQLLVTIKLHWKNGYIATVVEQ